MPRRLSGLPAPLVQSNFRIIVIADDLSRESLSSLGISDESIRNTMRQIATSQNLIVREFDVSIDTSRDRIIIDTEVDEFLWENLEKVVSISQSATGGLGIEIESIVVTTE